MITRAALIIMEGLQKQIDDIITSFSNLKNNQEAELTGVKDSVSALTNDHANKLQQIIEVIGRNDDESQQDAKQVMKILQLQNVAPFSGLCQREFTRFLTNLEKNRDTYHLSDSQMRSLSLAMTCDYASEFLLRKFKEMPNISWPTLKTLLKSTFENVQESDKQRVLMNIKQTKTDTINTFAEKIYKLSSEIYTPKELEDGKIQKFLVNIFTDGILDDKVATKLLRTQPTSLPQAVQAAHREYMLHNMIHLRKLRNEEDSTQDICAVDNKTEVDKLKLEIEALKSQIKRNENKQDSIKQQNSFNAPRKYEFTTDGRPICYFCKKEGHMSRECYSRKNQQFRNRSWSRPHMYKNDSYRPRVGQYPGIQNNNYNRYGRNDNYAENVDNRRQYGNPQVHLVNTLQENNPFISYPNAQAPAQAPGVGAY